MTIPYTPAQVIPPALATAVEGLPYWFVIGGQAVRCFAPYRPSRDVDFGIDSPVNLDDLVDQLRRQGRTDIQERSHDTVHLLWNGIKVSGFVLEFLVRHVEDRHLNTTGVLATKLHAILDRGLRRDFFDLYVMLQHHQLGIVAVLAAIHAVYQGQIDDGLMLRALTYFDDADREAALPAEGKTDWRDVKDYFRVQVGSLLVPPSRRLDIQSRTVDVRRSRLHPDRDGVPSRRTRTTGASDENVPAVRRRQGTGRPSLGVEGREVEPLDAVGKERGGPRTAKHVRRRGSPR